MLLSECRPLNSSQLCPCGQLKCKLREYKSRLKEKEHERGSRVRGETGRRREVRSRPSESLQGDLVFSRPSEAARVVWSFALDR